MGDTYDDVELHGPDIKVVSILRIGGPSKYTVRVDSGITDEFILRYVIPSLGQIISEEGCKILGTVLFFFIFEDSTNHIPEYIVSGVKTHMQGSVATQLRTQYLVFQLYP